MDIAALLAKRDYYQKNKHKIASVVRENYDTVFAIEYTHNSTAIEGNTLSLMETKLLLEDKLTVGGKALREIYEAVNHGKAFAYVKRCIEDGKPLDEKIVKDIHAILVENILVGGIYRDVGVYITGARHKPPAPNEAFRQVKDFYMDLQTRATQQNPIEYAAWTHAEFVKIHPFVDGNGRTARLLMNYQLMAAGFLPVSIAKENRLAYFDTLEVYAMDGTIQPFAEMIAELEEVQLDIYIAGMDTN